MTSTHRIQSIITRIANRHAFDFSSSEAHLRIEQPGYMPLVLEMLGENLLRVAKYYIQNGHAIAEPDVVFFIGRGAWIPVQITQSLGGYRRVAELSADGASVAKIDSRAMAVLVPFCNIWALNIEAQRWLEATAAPEGYSDAEAQAAGPSKPLA